MSQTTYRLASRAEVDLAVEWAQAEGWNPGVGDADVFWATDPEGFVCAERDGEVIATGSIVSYRGQFGFMGFFIVRPELRGHGIGRDFWRWRRDTLLDRLDPQAAIGMDGVFDMQPFYRAGGFTFAHRSIRMAGLGRLSDHHPQVSKLSSIPFESVAAYDRRHFGFDRRAFLRGWISPVGGLALGAVVNGSLAAMGVIRKCVDGYKIGPLFADSAEWAETMFVELSSFAVDRPIYIDVPEVNPDAVAMAQRHELTEVFGCARMYLGRPPALPWNQIYGVTTFELG